MFCLPVLFFLSSLVEFEIKGVILKNWTDLWRTFYAGEPLCHRETETDRNIDDIDPVEHILINPEQIVKTQ